MELRSYQYVETKTFWYSKTFWFNVLALLVAISVALIAGHELPESVVYWLSIVITVGNVVLRFITKGPVSWRNGDS